MSKTYIAIHQQAFIAQGTLEEVVRQVKSMPPFLEAQPLEIPAPGNQFPETQALEPIVIEEQSCQRLEINWQGDVETVLTTLAGNPESPQSRRGRPKLGVVSKEVTLLPEHWQWLATQRGGASATLRKLVVQAQKNTSVKDVIRLKQQQLDKFMLLFVGDAAGFEEATRSLYRVDRPGFIQASEAWPAQIKDFVQVKFNEIDQLKLGAEEVPK